MANKPKLAQGKPIGPDEQSARGPRLRAPGTEPVLIERSNHAEAVRRGAKSIVSFSILTVVVLIVLYLALAASLMAAVPGTSGLTWVARGTFIGGVPDRGDFIYASGAQNIEDTALGRLKEGTIGVRKGMTLEVVAGPFAKVSSSNGNIIVDDQPTIYYGEVMPRTLDKQYLAICIDGTCTQGEPLIVPRETIVGEAKGKLSLNGFSTFTSEVEGQE